MHRFPPVVDFAVASAVLEAAGEAENGADRVHDLSACQHFDSSLVAVLLELMRRAKTSGARCRFEGANDNLLKLAGLYGVGGLLFGAKGALVDAESPELPETPAGGARPAVGSGA
jgi:phospholipid transport system transporter-binding protein